MFIILTGIGIIIVKYSDEAVVSSRAIRSVCVYKIVF